MDWPWSIMEKYEKCLNNFGWIRPLRRPGRRWEDNIKTGTRETGSEYVDWNHLAQDRDRWQIALNAVINLRVPQKVGHFLIS